MKQSVTCMHMTTIDHSWYFGRFVSLNTSDLSPAIYKKLNSLWKIEDEKFVYMANIYMKLGQIEQAHQIYKRLLESK